MPEVLHGDDAGLREESLLPVTYKYVGMSEDMSCCTPEPLKVLVTPQ